MNKQITKQESGFFFKVGEFFEELWENFFG